MKRNKNIIRSLKYEKSIIAHRGVNMHFLFRIKNNFFRAFREIFIHHHGSLEFRAKLFALLIVVNENIANEVFDLINSYGMKIYNDRERANLLMLTVQELLKKVKEKNGLDVDTLIANIQKDLKIVPRYAKKIDVDVLREILYFTHDNDILAYQMNIIEFLEKEKNEILESKREQIESDEKMLKKSS